MVYAMSYKNIRSEYVKKKLKGTSWKNRKYIDDLIYLEEWIMGEIGGCATAMNVNNKKSKYNEEYWAILKELKPERYKRKIRDLEKKKKEKEERKKQLEKERQERYEQERREWEEMGGKN